MNFNLPSMQDVRRVLSPLTLRQIDVLSDLSSVPPTTIYKIKNGLTKNPGVITLKKLLPHVATAMADSGGAPPVKARTRPASSTRKPAAQVPRQRAERMP